MNMRSLFIFFFLIINLNILPANIKTDIGLTPQKAPNGKWGYLDDKGFYKIRPQFEMALPFKEGLALISVCNKYGFIDEKGKPVIRPQFDEARSFSESLAAVMIYDQKSNKKWGFIDKTGNFVVFPQYDDVTDFRDLEAQVKLNGKTLTINNTGGYI
ncbi:MAG: WG repeat-containing protein [Spirochaetota bacterium]